MFRRPRIAWAAALAALASLSGGLLDRPAARAWDDHGSGAHQDMFFTSPAEERLTIRMVGDERFTDQPLTVSTKEVKDQVVALIEGDMFLGRRDELLAIELAQLVSDAKNLDPDSPQLKAVLTPAELNVLNVLRSFQVGDADLGRQLRDDAANALAGPILARAKALVGEMPANSAVPPQALVDAVTKARQLQQMQRAAIIVGSRYRWPNGVVPYYYDRAKLSPALTSNIDAAVAHWNAKTKHVLIRPTRQTDPYYVEFVPGVGCGSYVGKVRSSGPQEITLADGCGFDQIVHEIGHALGLFHEQSRSDRDRFLTIQIQNAIDGTASNFQLPEAGTSRDLGPFDFASVMLYAYDAFTANGKPTMVPTPLVRDQVGLNWGINRRGPGLVGLSRGDVAAVETMYPDPARDAALSSPAGPSPFESPATRGSTPTIDPAAAAAPAEARPSLAPPRDLLKLRPATAPPASPPEPLPEAAPAAPKG